MDYLKMLHKEQNQPTMSPKQMMKSEESYDKQTKKIKPFAVDLQKTHEEFYHKSEADLVISENGNIALIQDRIGCFYILTKENKIILRTVFENTAVHCYEEFGGVLW